MPGYFDCGMGEQLPGGGSRITSTVATGQFQAYDSPRPVIPMAFPMTGMTEIGAVRQSTYELEKARLIAGGLVYWVARIYRNYDGLRGKGNNLDMHLEVFGDTNVYHFELVMLVYVADGEARDEHRDVKNKGGDHVYPAPSQWYIAERLIYVRRWTAAEYAALVAPAAAVGAPGLASN